MQVAGTSTGCYHLAMGVRHSSLPCACHSFIQCCYFSCNLSTGQCHPLFLLACAVVWADTQSMGCGTTACPDGNRVNFYTVCQYYPQGNYQWCNLITGECWSYNANVFRTACQNQTQNDGCSQCSSSGKCAACFPETRTYDAEMQTVRVVCLA